MVGLFGMVWDLKMMGNKKIPTLKRGVPRGGPRQRCQSSDYSFFPGIGRLLPLKK